VILKIDIKKLKTLSIIKNFPAAFCLVTVLMTSLGLFSCQKVINMDLNSASPQLVVEANITDKPGPYFVKLSKTVNFDKITEIPPVTGAIVEISDSSGYSETLTELSDGIYSTSKLAGIPGHKYRLTIKSDGQIYESVSVMPYPVGGLKLEIKKEVNDRNPFRGGSSNQFNRYTVNYEINDPVEFNNYYRFVVYDENGEISSRRVFSDQYRNGKIIADDFTLNDTINFNPGDTIRIELQNVDKNTYNFFRTLREGAGGLSFLSASPSNPISSITNNGLGYFNACSVKEGFVIIPK
jgi:hypothetical protein